MKKLLGLLVFIPFLISGCINGIAGKGEVLTKQYSFETFTGVDYGLPGKVIFEQGEQFVSVKTNENLFDYLEMEVVRGVLNIKVQKGYSIMDYDEMELHISIPSLSYFETDGSGDMISSKPIVVENDLGLKIDGSGDLMLSYLECEDLNMEIDGSGEIQIEKIKGSRLECNIDGSGDISIEGEGKKFEIDIDGSGNVKTGNLKVKDADIDINGSGSSYIWATDDLQIRINGSGSVFYKGSPDINSEINGSGTVKKL